MVISDVALFVGKKWYTSYQLNTFSAVIFCVARLLEIMCSDWDVDIFYIISIIVQLVINKMGLTICINKIEFYKTIVLVLSDS